MPGGPDAFFGLVQTPLVRHGGDVKLPKGQHRFPVVYAEMLFQICSDFPGLSDPLGMKASAIRFFYEGLRSGLHELTKPKR